MSEINTWPTQGWRCVRLLGEGSFGKVNEIARTEFGREYRAALKVITVPQSRADLDNAYSDGLDEKSVTAYFREIVEDISGEVALMSQLRGHSHIVSYDDHIVLEHKSEVGWDILIRMELLTPLHAWCAGRSLTQEEVIRLGCDLCRALELCQRKNIIHRDIKPENIFINEFGDFKLGDFGIARTVERTMSNLSKKGTYTYMAPEVYLGKAYNQTVDIYSLGVVLYRYLNENRTPFLPQGALKYRDREEAQRRRMAGEAVPPPCNGSQGLCSVVLKALAFDPKERYQTAGEFRAALESCLNSASETPLKPPQGEEPDETSNVTQDLWMEQDGTMTVKRAAQSESDGTVHVKLAAQEGTVDTKCGKPEEKKPSKRKRLTWAVALTIASVVWVTLSFGLIEREGVVRTSTPDNNEWNSTTSIMADISTQESVDEGGIMPESTNENMNSMEDNSTKTETARTQFGALATVTEGVLTVSTNAMFPPYEMVGADGSLEGIDIEIAEAIAERLGLDIEILNMSFLDAIASVQAGQSDISIAGISVTEELLEAVDFTDSYVSNVQVVIVFKDSPVKTISDLANVDMIGCQADTTGYIYASDKPENGGFGEDHVTAYESGTLAVEALMNNQVDAVIIDSASATALVEASEGLRILDTAWIIQDYSIAVAKGNTELLERLNSVISSMREDGTISEILARYHVI